MTIRHVGFLGLGLMGSRMALNLKKKGFEVTVWNRSAARAEALQAHGIHVAKTPAQVAQVADVLELFAVRRGTLKFRGWEPTTVPPTVDAHYAERFEQKGVDMRIGLDIADYSTGRFVDRIALITADTDMIPAMKHARRAGMQVALVSMGSQRLSSELISHADIHRAVTWP